MNNQIMEKDNLSRNKTAIITSGAVAIFLILGGVVNISLTHQKDLLRAQLTGLEGQIENIEAMADKNKTIEERIQILKERYQHLGDRLPPKEEESLGLLSTYAQKFHIEIISIKAQPKRGLLDINQQKMEVEGKTCQEVPVAIEMKGAYKDAVQYIEILKNALPAYTVLEKLKMRKDTADQLKLNIQLDLNLYLLSQANDE